MSEAPYDQCAKFAGRFARRFALDADDCRQVAAIACWQALENYRPGGKSLRQWCFLRAKYALLSFRRNEGPWGRGSRLIGSVRRGCYTGRIGSLSARVRRQGTNTAPTLGDLVPDPVAGQALEALEIRDCAEWLLALAGPPAAELLRRRLIAGEPMQQIAADLRQHQTGLDSRLRAVLSRLTASARARLNDATS